MLGRQLAHLARAEEQDLKPCESPKIFFASSTAAYGTETAARRCRCRCGRVWPRASSVRKPGERIGSSDPELLARHERGAHLAGDLRLADDHRVESRGNAEEMLEHVAVAEDVEVFFELVRDRFRRVAPAIRRRAR